MRNADPVSGGGATLFFDGSCGLCNRFVRFVAARDPADNIHLVPLQSTRGGRVIDKLGLPTQNYETMVVESGGKLHVKSGAVIEIFRILGWPWALLAAGRCVPRKVRDSLYDLVSRNRFRLFGRGDSCSIPSPELRRKMSLNPPDCRMPGEPA